MKNKAIFLFLILGIVIFIIKLPISAGENCSGGPEDSQGCTNGGDLRNGCNWICNNSAPPGTILEPPSCCEILAQTGDPTVCCFDARRRCTVQQCSSIPEGVRKERCGQLWELGGYCNEPTPTPFIPSKPTSIPPTTVIPQPTKKIIQPTTILRTAPTLDMRPSINTFPTTTLQNIPPSQSSQFEFPSIQFPKFTLPKVQINLVLNIIEYAFQKILYYDRKLENIVNEQLRKIL